MKHGRINIGYLKYLVVLLIVFVPFLVFAEDPEICPIQADLTTASCPTQDDLNYVYKGGKGKSSSDTVIVFSLKYMYKGGAGQNYFDTCTNILRDRIFHGGSGQMALTSCPISNQKFSYMYEGLKGQTYAKVCNETLFDRIYHGGSGQVAFTTCNISDQVFSYMFEGTKGQGYTRLCNENLIDRIYLGGKGQAAYTTCLVSNITHSYMYEGAKGQTYTQLCNNTLIDRVYLGGGGETSFTTCPELHFAFHPYKGGIGKTSKGSCFLPFTDLVFKGGIGQNAYTTCIDVSFDIISKGGIGENSFYSCYLPFEDIIYKGGKGQTTYTSCPDVSFDIISRGGKGKPSFNSCFLPFVDRIYKGGLGQNSYTTCFDVAFDLVSKGGSGQTFFNTCRDDSFDRIYKGGVGQTYFQTCADITSLFIYKTVDNDISCTGRTNVFTITIENKDWAIYDMANINIRDSLGMGLLYKGFSASSGSFDPLTGIWTVPSLPRGQTETLTLRAGSETKGELTNYAWIKSASTPKAIARDTVSASVLAKEGGIPRADIRAQIMATPHREVNLSSFLDTLFQYTKWSIAKAPEVAPADKEKFEKEGKLNTGIFVPGETYGYRVRVEDECLTDSVTAYVKVLTDRVLYPRERTVTVCCSDEKVTNLTAIIGIEAGQVEWNIAPFEASNYLGTSSRNAVVYNIEKAYWDSSIPKFDHNGGVDNAMKITFYYKVKESTSVLNNEVYTLHLIITDKMLP